MQWFLGLALALLNGSPLTAYPDSSARSTDLEIARSLRTVVRHADADLLNSAVLSVWRDYLMLSASNLDAKLQPLLLIKFDRDVAFRNQFKELISWESEFEKQETEHGLYYYRWHEPVPRLFLAAMDSLIGSISNQFSLPKTEKIPYRYDPTIAATKFYPFDDLRGGIFSNQPLALRELALAAFKAACPHLDFMTSPLSLMYGTFFQNAAASLNYYRKCNAQVEIEGYTSAIDLYALPADEIDDSGRCSAYVFVYRLCDQFSPAKVGILMQSIDDQTPAEEFALAFERIFGMTLQHFEVGSGFRPQVIK